MKVQISHLPEVIEVDESIELRAKSFESFDAFSNLVKNNREYLSEWLPWAKNAPDESSLEHYSQAPNKKLQNESADWDIYFEGELVGAIGAMNRNPDRKVLELGYWLSEDQNGKGIMTKSTAVLVDILFENTDTPSVEIGADSKNLKSRAVPERCGFKFDREFTDNPNCPQVELGVFYSLSREEWQNQNSH